MSRYKENLPKNCPPISSRENIDTLVLYRVFVNNKFSEDEFLPYSRLFPNNPRYQTDCGAKGVSFFSTYEAARAKCLDTYTQRKRKIGNFIAKIRFKHEKIGKYKCTDKTQHCNVWFYLIADIDSDLECIELIEVSYECG